jgi:hypothetical protein
MFAGRSEVEMDRKHLGVVLSLVTVFALVAFAAATPAFAHHKDGHDQGPSDDRASRDASADDSQGNGGPECPGSSASFKVDRMITNGTYSDGTVTITVTNATDTSFEWSANLSLDSVVVKGGTTREVSPGGTSGSARSAINQSSGQRYDISHVTFCYSTGSVVTQPPTKLCPARTDNAGMPYDDIDECEDKDVVKPGANKICPSDTDNAGMAYDDIDECDDEDVVKPRRDKVCPANSDRAGEVMDDLDDCDRDAVLPNVIRRDATPTRQAPDDEVEAGGVLPFTGGSGVAAVAALGALLMSLGALSLGARRQR